MSSPLWRRRAHLATEAMIVAAMPLFGVGLGSHLVNNALAPIFMAGPGDESDSVIAALHHVYDHEVATRAKAKTRRVEWSSEPLPARADAEKLFLELDAIWRASHAGRFVTPDSLDRLVSLVDRADRRALRSKRSGGFWIVEVISLVTDAEHVIAGGAHPMYAVAAELCRSSLAVEEGQTR